MREIDYLKQNGVDVDHALELLGDIDMYNEMLETFVLESSSRLERLNNNKVSDLSTYVVDTHAMKSDSKYLGFTKLAELSYNHEMAGKEANNDFIRDNYDALIEEANNVIKIVNIYLGKEA